MMRLEIGGKNRSAVVAETGIDADTRALLRGVGFSFVDGRRVEYEYVTAFIVRDMPLGFVVIDLTLHTPDAGRLEHRSHAAKMRSGQYRHTAHAVVHVM